MAIAAVLALATGCGGGAASSAKPTPADLAKMARVSEPEARKIALARVPGEVKSQELEVEHDELVYSYDIERPGEPGVDEVQVDAMSGKIVSIVHESPVTEKKERD
jgi:uncharacterized membrane protein YkoI